MAEAAQPAADCHLPTAGQHLYLHIPYCARKCPYCDFNSIAGREDEQAAYVAALLAEVGRLPAGPYATVFIGGGTPTSLRPDLLERLMRGLSERIALSDGHEWTCEANPGSADAERFAILAAHRVNRLSLGVQSTHPRHLAFLGRIHGPDEAERALALAVAAVPRVSCDLMFGLPGQTDAEVLADLDLARRHQLGHVSAYHLAIEPGTEFAARHARGELGEIDGGRSRDLLALVRATLAGWGLAAYETSNFAAPGQACRHNLAYWQLADYHAAGAGAVATVAGERTTRERHPGRYIAAIAAGGDAVAVRETLSALDRRREAWMLGLRLSEGVDLARLAELGDEPRRWRLAADQLAIEGLIVEDGGRLRLTAAGVPVQDAVTVRLMP